MSNNLQKQLLLSSDWQLILKKMILVISFCYFLSEKWNLSKCIDESNNNKLEAINRLFE